VQGFAAEDSQWLLFGSTYSLPFYFIMLFNLLSLTFHW